MTSISLSSVSSQISSNIFSKLDTSNQGTIDATTLSKALSGSTDDETGDDAVENALGLAEGIAEQHAGLASGLVAAPPGVDLAEDLLLGFPAVDRQAEGGFGDEGVTAHRLERRAGAVGLDLVVTGRDPDLAPVFQAYLGRAEHMAGGVEAEGDAVVIEGFAVGQGLQVDIGAQTAAQDAGAGGGAEVVTVAGAGVIAMTVGDDRPLHRPPGVDVEVAGWAVEAFGAGDDKVHGRAAGWGLVSVERWGVGGVRFRVVRLALVGAASAAIGRVAATRAE